MRVRRSAAGAVGVEWVRRATIRPLTSAAATRIRNPPTSAASTPPSVGESSSRPAGRPPVESACPTSRTRLRSIRVLMASVTVEGLTPSRRRRSPRLRGVVAQRARKARTSVECPAEGRRRGGLTAGVMGTTLCGPAKLVPRKGRHARGLLERIPSVAWACGRGLRHRPAGSFRTVGRSQAWTSPSCASRDAPRPRSADEFWPWAKCGPGQVGRAAGPARSASSGLAHSALWARGRPCRSRD